MEESQSMEEIIDVVGDMSQDDTFSSASSVTSEKENHNSTSEQDPNAAERKYFCQRCLNHGFEHPRKGHKPHCKYAKCDCKDCSMVERRRQLNNILSKCNPAVLKTEVVNGKKSRVPCCSRCACHGHINPLKGHKKALCPFRDCQCKTCAMVVLRRDCMAAQVKLRRGQSKGKSYGSSDANEDCVAFMMPKIGRGKGRARKMTSTATANAKITMPQLSCVSPSPPALSPTFSLSSFSSNVSSPAPSPLLQTEFSMPTTTVTTTVTSVNTAPLPAGILIPTPLTAVPPVLNSIIHTPSITNLNTGLPAPRAIKPIIFGEVPSYDLNSTINQLSLQRDAFGEFAKCSFAFSKWLKYYTDFQLNAELFNDKISF